jgi:carnitine 3-dehydrogenase
MSEAGPSGSGPAFGPVAVLGAGTIGAGWAAFFALSGLDVRVLDPAESAVAAITLALDRARPVMAALGLLSPTPTVPRVTPDMASAVTGAVHVQDALPEQLELKRTMLAEVEAHVAVDTLIASSSSGLQPSLMQHGMRHPERFVIAHPCNPPYLMPVVEIVGGSQTAPWAIEAAKAFYEGLGKQVIVLRREVTGHLINRLQAALWREAVHLVAEGYASVEDVDLAVTAGLGARWAVCGPHQIFHLSGGDAGMQGFLDRLGPAVQSWWADLGTPTLNAATCKALVDGMNEASNGRSVADMATERDRRMIQVLATVAHIDNPAER